MASLAETHPAGGDEQKVIYFGTAGATTMASTEMRTSMASG